MAPRTRSSAKNDINTDVVQVINKTLKQKPARKSNETTKNRQKVSKNSLLKNEKISPKKTSKTNKKKNVKNVNMKKNSKSVVNDRKANSIRQEHQKKLNGSFSTTIPSDTEDSDYLPEDTQTDDDFEPETHQNETKPNGCACKRKRNNKQAAKMTKETNFSQSDDEDDEVDDWEEVEDAPLFDINNYNPELPDNLQITLEKPATKKKRFNRQAYIRDCIRCDINHIRKKIQLNAHQTHLLLYIYRLQYLNSIINDDLMRALILSIDIGQIASLKLSEVFKQFNDYFKVSIKRTKLMINDIQEKIIDAFQKKKITSVFILNLIMLALFRCSGWKARLCYLLYPVPIKPMDLLMKTTKLQKNKEEPILVEEPKINDFNDCYWIEVLDSNNKWISADFANKIYEKSTEIADKRKRLLKNISYVLAIDNNGFVNDVTQRYARNWFSHERIKNRIDEKWWKETLKIVQNPNGSMEMEADRKEFDELLVNAELPRCKSEYKNHPLFVLEHDVLKFQALYPPDLPPLGFFNDIPVYSRDCVHTLRSRETWLKEARQVKLNEKPYKVVLSLFRRKKVLGTNKTVREELELFGHWQTEPYVAPVASNGIVPRNAFGNVDLYDMSMLPKGTVYLQLKELDKIAYKLNIDCAPAIVGFDANRKKMRFVPLIGGYVVCQEFQHQLINAWNEYQKEQTIKNQDKKLKRIQANWKRLIRTMIIRHNLKIKYGI